MPYIDQERRKAIFGESNFDFNSNLQTSGELNYYLTCVVQEYIKHHGLRYETINDVLGVLEAIKLEFNRRVVVPYEEEKRRSNGDVYTKGE